MEKLNNDELFSIAIKLDFNGLQSFCKINKKTFKLWQTDTVWNYKLHHEFSDYNTDFKFISKRNKYVLLYNLNYIKDIYKIEKSLTNLYCSKKINLSMYHHDKNNIFCSNLQLIPDIPKKIKYLENLKELRIIGHCITELPLEIFQLYNLKSLHLNDNAIYTIPKEISQLKKLKLLDLHDNEITELPQEILQLKLEILDLSGNYFRRFPVQICNINTLTHLNLKFNYISEIPDCISNLENLQVLEMRENNITKVSKLLLKLEYLKTVNYLVTKY